MNCHAEITLDIFTFFFLEKTPPQNTHPKPNQASMSRAWYLPTCYSSCFWYV